MNSYHHSCKMPAGRGECHMQMGPSAAFSKSASCGMTMPECGCEEMPGKKEWPIGMTYVPMQKWGNIYQAEEGFQKGTIFKELDLPFTGRRMCK